MDLAVIITVDGGAVSYVVSSDDIKVVVVDYDALEVGDSDTKEIKEQLSKLQGSRSFNSSKRSTIEEIDMIENDRKEFEG